MLFKLALLCASLAVGLSSGEGESCSEEIHGGPRTGGVFRSFLPRKWKACAHGSGDAGDPLFLTPLLRNGSIEKAVALSTVHGATGPHLNPPSHSGFLTVNDKYHSNMFFWFFPARNNAKDAPVLLWLQGGPGASSLYGMFVEIGPIKVDEDGVINYHNITWNHNYSLLFIDNPVGTGFSFTEADAGYARNEDDVARDLYSGLTQFFSIFKDYQKNDFYVTGESYAGKYVPSISRRILEGNAQGKETHINFRGMAIGDGLIDPLSMNNYYADLMSQMSLIDDFQAEHVRDVVRNITTAIKAQQFVTAFHLFDDLLNGDLIDYPSWYKNVTGSSNYFNILRDVSPPEGSYFLGPLSDKMYRLAIHVGDRPYNSGNVVEEHLLNDIQNTSLPAFLDVLTAANHTYKVMVYNGQLDVIVGAPLTEGMLAQEDWPGKAQFYSSGRKVWRIDPEDTEVAGYVRTYRNLAQVVVRGAGHMVPFDQPARALDLITRFVEGNMP